MRLLQADRLNRTGARGIALVVGVALVVTMSVATGRMRLFPTSSEVAVGSGSAGASDMAVKEQVVDAYGALPLPFIPNAGQADAQVRYAAQGPGFAVSFTREEALLSFVNEERGHTLALRFLEANPQAELTARQQLPGTVNYLIGERAEWRSGIPTYQEVIYRNLWPGVDAVFRGGEGELKYEFHLAPGARVGDVRLGYSGADRLALGPGGQLLIHTPLGILRDARPLSYQWMGGTRAVVQSRYVVGSGGTYGFDLGPGYDPRRPLVIDPELAFSTFLGGMNQEWGADIAVDRAGNAYVTGLTSSPDFPTTPGAFDRTHNHQDAFVTKLRPDGAALMYSTFLGGESFDSGRGIAVDPGGHAYVTGVTESLDFPTTPGAFDSSYNGNRDAFVTKLAPDGSALAYSTFLGAASLDESLDIGVATEVHSPGHAFVTGLTYSPEFPTSPGAFDTSHNGFYDVFVTRLGPDGSSLDYSTFLGGDDGDGGYAIAVDGTGHAFVTGPTNSPQFPTTPGAFDRIYNGLGDAFVAKLRPDGSALDHSTFLGGQILRLRQRHCGRPRGSCLRHRVHRVARLPDHDGGLRHHLQRVGGCVRYQGPVGRFRRRLLHLSRRDE